MADLSTKTVSLDDFPPELLHMLAPHLEANSITSLRAVSRRFNNIFNNDVYWKNFLHYPVKHFKCDLRFRSEADGLADVFEEIDREDVGKWLGYYKLQRAHLENWVSGRNCYFRPIALLPSMVSHMEEMVDDSGEHFLFFSVGNNIHLWNITAEPMFLGHTNVGPHIQMHVLPQGILLLKDATFRIIVYRFEKPSNLRLQHKFMFDMENACDVLLQWNLRFGFRYVVIRDLLIGYDSDIRYKENTLHIWNLRSTAKVATVSVLQEFNEFMRSNNIMTQRFDGFRLDLFAGDYPNVVVVFKGMLTISLVTIFNVKTRQFTHIVIQLQSKVVYCSNFADKVCVEELVNPEVGTDSSCVSIYSLKTQSVSREGVLVYRIPLVFLMCPRSCTSIFQHNDNAFFRYGKAFVKTENEIHIYNLDSDRLQYRRFAVTPNFAILTFIKPKLLLMYNLFSPPTETEVKVYNVISGQEICSWENVNISDKFLTYFRNLEFPSKLVLSIFSEKLLRLYRF